MERITTAKGLKHGDKIILEIFGLGVGNAEIEKHEDTGELMVFEPSNGYIKLEEALKNKSITLYKTQ